MSILCREDGRLFTLHTRHSTYQMSVDGCGFLRHLYYGRRVEGDTLDYLHPAMDRGFSGNPPDRREDRAFSLDTIPQEYTSSGVGDFRADCVRVVNGDGSFQAEFRYEGFRVYDGKYALPGLPAAYDHGGEAQTLEITLRDSVTKLGVRLYYGVFEERDVITRAAEIFNGGGEPAQLDKAASFCLDMPFGQWDLLHFHGRHCMERQVERVPLTHSIQTIASRRGASSHHHNPFVILCDREAGEDHGDCYGFMLVWSGSHQTEIEVDQAESTRIIMGIHDAGFRWTLKPGASFYAPEALLSYSRSGLTPLSQQFHAMIRRNICRGKHQFAPRPVLINNWEATYFDFNTDKLLRIARQAADLGVELFVLDDGWFGKRGYQGSWDNAGLGDWQVNEGKLPGGLAPLIEQIRAMGLWFGIWMEPEMVNEDSDLYRAHPDWVLSAPGRTPMYCRNQLVLDLSREDVQEYVYNCIAAILGNYRVSYLKWDMNRSVSDVYSHAAARDRQGEIGYRYVLGVYAVLERLTREFPDVLIEGCAGGGGRFDAGMLHYTPQIWCSDDTDPMERLKIQYGTSFGYPVSAVGAHVSASPNHQSGRTTPLHTRGVVAMSGTFGYELDPERLTEAEKEEIRRQIADFKKYYYLIQEGLYYRLESPMGASRLTAWEFAAADGSEALLNVVAQPQANPLPVHIRLKGLDPEGRYRIEGEDRVYSGAALMYGGYTFPFHWGQPPYWTDYPAAQLHIVKV